MQREGWPRLVRTRPGRLCWLEELIVALCLDGEEVTTIQCSFGLLLSNGNALGK